LHELAGSPQGSRGGTAAAHRAGPPASGPPPAPGAVEGRVVPALRRWSAGRPLCNPHPDPALTYRKRGIETPML
jgi:hypothetical protein